MYTEFYNLHSKPFQISSDPAFMWFGEKHKEALATLKYGILDNKGFLLLTGDVGTGKTSLINALIESLSDDIICTSVPDPSLEKMDFLNYIAAAFGMTREFNAKGAFLAHFRQFLLEAYQRKKKVLLIIDEAQLLTQEMLEEIRLLSNIEKSSTKLINIFFIGQNEFNEILNRPQNRAVRQRLTLNYNLDPLTPDETESYIRHRLEVAGCNDMLFNRSAVQEIFLYSGGFPRRINILCDHSLLSGYVKEEKIIHGRIVQECAKELKIPAHVRNRDIDGFDDAPAQRRAPKYTAEYTARSSPVPQPQTPAPPPPQYAYYPPPPKYEEKKGGFGSIIGWTAAVFLFCMFAWFFMFPGHFKASMSMAGQNFTMLKNQILPVVQKLRSSSQDTSKMDSSPAQDQTQAVQSKAPVRSDSNALNSGNSGQISEGQIDAENPSAGTSAIESTHYPENTSAPLLNAESEKPSKIQPIQEDIVDTPAAGDTMVVKPIKKPTEQSENISLTTLPETKKLSPIPLPKEKVIVRFKYNTNDFTEKGFEELEEFSNALATHPETKILITGYTDSEGYAKYNQKLSEFRANIVKSFLLGKGVKSDQIQIQGLGGENPIESNDTAWGRQMNRRVEIEILN